MSTITSDEQSFLTAICTNPDDDTARLVYADWLDEQDDPSRAARAEFIRVQVELAKFSHCANCGGTSVMRYDGVSASCQWCADARPLRHRESELLTIHCAAWLCGPVCAECYIKVDTLSGAIKRAGCVHCTGDAGGLLRKLNYTHEGHTRWGTTAYGLDENVRVTFRRGFPSRVEVPRLADAIEEVWVDDPSQLGTPTVCQLRPTPWLRAVLAAHPVTEVVPLDRVPFHSQVSHKWIWFEGSYDRHSIPRSMFDLLPKKPVPKSNLPRSHKSFDSEVEAITAIAHMICTIGRS